MREGGERDGMVKTKFNKDTFPQHVHDISVVLYACDCSCTLL